MKNLETMTKQELVSLFWTVTKGGDGSRLTKAVLIKTLKNKLKSEIRDEKLKELGI
jgi:hypothetical protein